MNSKRIRELCLSMPGATEQIQWGNDLLFKVGGKMFLCIGLEPGSGYSIKCSDDSFYELTELPGIKPAPYLARAHWVQIDASECLLKSSEIESLIRRSYELVLAKLPKKTQESLKQVSQQGRQKKNAKPAADRASDSGRRAAKRK